METISTISTNEVKSVKQELSDILLIVSWREVARTYFGKSSSWLYHKLDGIDGNGGTGGFSLGEKQELRDALLDLSKKIETCAKRI